jgi:hypothetical protein
MIVAPLLLGIGVPENLLGFCILHKDAKLQRSTCRVYLMVLSDFDSGALVFGLIPKWLIFQFGIDVTLSHDWTCKLRAFLFYSCPDVSIWLICAFSFDRLVAVRGRPLELQGGGGGWSFFGKK